MRVGLFIPCYVDQLRPEVGLATLDLLERMGVDYAFRSDAVCCGQPFLTAGDPVRARKLAARFVAAFKGFDRVVTPSASCAATLRMRLPELIQDEEAIALAGRVRELSEFLVEAGGVGVLTGRFSHRVGLHASCHALRELRLGAASERPGIENPDPARQLLEGLAGLTIVDLKRADECCGFGGVFAVKEEAVSVRMGEDRLADHAAAGAEVIASTDASCLLQLEGIARSQGRKLPVLHVAEILAEGCAR
jgi:L-lactate dehydrogenase complex protein LldE